jgi:hypothetical protein
VRDYGTEAQWRSAGGSAQYFQTLPTVDLLNRCVPTRAVSSTSDPPLCAYPACDGTTMVCDTQRPQLWLLRSIQDRSRCQVRFEHVEVDQFATMRPSPLTARLADNMAFVQRLVESMERARTEVLVLGLAAPVVLGLAWLLLLRFFARTIVWLAIIAIGLLLLLCTLYFFVVSGVLDTFLGTLAPNNTAVGNASAALSAAVNQASSTIVELAPDRLSNVRKDLENENPALYQIAAWVTCAAPLRRRVLRTPRDRASLTRMPVFMLRAGWCSRSFTSSPCASHATRSVSQPHSSRRAPSSSRIAPRRSSSPLSSSPCRHACTRAHAMPSTMALSPSRPVAV